jgi:hypothetical protein
MQLETSSPDLVPAAESLKRPREFFAEALLKEGELLVGRRVRAGQSPERRLASGLPAARVVDGGVGHYAVQPGGEADFMRVLLKAAGQLAPDALGNVFGIFGATHHTQRDLPDVAVAPLVKLGEGRRIALRGASGKLVKLLVVGW